VHFDIEYVGFQLKDVITRPYSIKEIDQTIKRIFEEDKLAEENHGNSCEWYKSMVVIVIAYKWINTQSAQELWTLFDFDYHIAKYIISKFDFLEEPFFCFIKSKHKDDLLLFVSCEIYEESFDTALDYVQYENNTAKFVMSGNFITIRDAPVDPDLFEEFKFWIMGDQCMKDIERYRADIGKETRRSKD